VTCPETITLHKMSALELLCNSLCGALTRKYGDPGLDQLCPTEMPYWGKSCATIFMRGAHCTTYVHFGKKDSLKLLKAFEY